MDDSNLSHGQQTDLFRISAVNNEASVQRTEDSFYCLGDKHRRCG